MIIVMLMVMKMVMRMTKVAITMMMMMIVPTCPSPDPLQACSMASSPQTQTPSRKNPQVDKVTARQSRPGPPT